MRLLNVHSLCLEEFSINIPPYAILSHTWSTEEVTFSDISSGQAKARTGYAKIKNSCSKAAQRKLDYCWIDTCCIDKSSSSELSEAIDSMFKWYASSQTCFVFLEDVVASSHEKDLPAARWFTRGWTLQELLAPKRVEFFDKYWELLGQVSKSTDMDFNFQTATGFMEGIYSITGINSETLQTQMSFLDKSIATRMSWASQRKTTRVEDMAYCLLGLFQVNMPLLYGEGNNAFIRLQEEIIKISNDHSIFVWGIVGRLSWRTHCLAQHVEDFRTPRDVVPFGKNHSTPAYTMTNKGLRIDLPVIGFKDDQGGCLAFSGRVSVLKVSAIAF